MHALVTPIADLITPHQAASVATPADFAAYTADITSTKIASRGDAREVELGFICSIKDMLASPGFADAFNRQSGKVVIMANHQMWAVEIAHLMMGHSPDPTFDTLEGYTPDPAFQTH
jgi:hypothetical protein